METVITGQKIHAWDMVDMISRHVLEHLTQDEIEEEYTKTYENVKAAWKEKSIHRVLVPCALVHMTMKVRGKRIRYKDMIPALEKFDLKKHGINCDVKRITHGAVIRTVKKLVFDSCDHEHLDTKTRIIDKDDPVDDDAQFLRKQRAGYMELYCIACGKVLSSKDVIFKHILAMDLIRRHDPLQEGILLKKLIELLHKEYLLAPKRNPDARKAESAAYVAAKGFLAPFFARGLLKTGKEKRNKRVWWVKNIR